MALELREQFLGWMHVEQGRSVHTVDAYRRDLADYESWLHKRRSAPVGATSADVEAFVQHLRARGLAATTVARRFAAVRVFHRWMCDEGRRRDDPCALVDGVRVPAGLPKALTEESVEALLAAVTGDDSLARRDRALLEFLYATGARISEVCGLSMADLDMDDSLARLLGKGNKERIVPFGSGAHRALRDWFDEGGRARLVPARWRSRDDADAVFLGVRGTRLTRQAAFTIVRKWATVAGIREHLSPHVLRHSCATHMLVHGADLRVVQELLGHSSVSTTQVYTRVDNDLLAETYRAAHPRAMIER
ncbi:MAG: site-specific tyrosine recombinase [Ilumatobacteraceae bacterium]